MELTWMPLAIFDQLLESLALAVGEKTSLALQLCFWVSLALAVLFNVLFAPRHDVRVYADKKSLVLSPRLMGGLIRLVYLWASFALLFLALLMLGSYIALVVNNEARFDAWIIVFAIVWTILLELAIRLASEILMLPVLAVEELFRIRHALVQSDSNGASSVVATPRAGQADLTTPIVTQPEPTAPFVAQAAATAPLAPQATATTPLSRQAASITPASEQAAPTVGKVAVPADPFVPADQQASTMPGMWDEKEGDAAQTTKMPATTPGTSTSSTGDTRPTQPLDR